MAAVLIINPRTDRAFVDRVEALADGATSPDDLEALLRREYPRVLVRSRDLEAESKIVWYVYREGRWIPPAGGREVQGER